MGSTSAPTPSLHQRPARLRPRFAFLLAFPLLLLPNRASGTGLQATKAPQSGAPQTTAQTKTQQSASTSPGKAHPAKRTHSKGKSRGGRSSQRGQRAPTPQRISEVQSALARSGHYSGEPTGKWDASTVQAMKKYQEANRLPPTGKLDARTLQKLGLGSPITGVAAPHSPAPTPPAASHTSPAHSAAVPPAKIPPAAPPASSTPPRL